MSCVYQAWIGTDRGVIFIYDVVSHKMMNQLTFHVDAVSCILLASDRLVFTAAGKLDGRVAVWRWQREQRKAATRPKR